MLIHNIIQKVETQVFLKEEVEIKLHLPYFAFLLSSKVTMIYSPC